jgi:folate-dependent phosphoribosylglycinamide formyltransferase PurN
MEAKNIILLATKSDTTNILYNKLNDTFGIAKVILEENPTLKNTLKRKIKRKGLLHVVGQILFKATVNPYLQTISSSRINQIISQHKLNRASIAADKVVLVDSVNSPTTISLLKSFEPDLIIVHGTRIISADVLNNISCKMMNIHAGITPKYRGVHGGYWSLANNDQINCGVTVHFIDKGIDTGDIIAQDTITLTASDNFYTYPYLQFAKGIELLTRAIKDHFEGKLVAKKAVGESVLRHMPTAFEYLYNRWKKKVK